MSVFTLAITCLTNSNLPQFMDLTFQDLTFQLHTCCNIAFSASDLASITSPIHNWVWFLLWLSLFILSGVISPLISSSMLDTYQPGEFMFQWAIFLPFHTVHGVFNTRTLKWFAIPSPVEHILSELSTMTRVSCVALQVMAHSFTELDKAVVHVIRLISFL